MSVRAKKLARISHRWSTAAPDTSTTIGKKRGLVACSVLVLLFAAGPAGGSELGNELQGDLQSSLQLVRAVKHKNTSAVRTLLEQGVDANVPEGDGATALHWAAYWDDLETVGRLIAAGANVNATNDLMVTPLALASANGNAAIVGHLLRAGADLNAAGETGVTPLMEAARTGSLDAVRVLLEFDGDVNAYTNDQRQTALMWAVAQQHPEVVGLLLETGADPHARTRTRRNIVMLDRGPRRVAKTSSEVGTEVEMGGITALLFAAQVGDVGSARLLLRAGAEINEAGSDGNSPLVVAAISAHGALASFFLDEGADPDTAGGGYTALHAAVLRSDLGTVETLLAHGADPDLPLTKGSPVRRNGSQWALSSAWAGATPLLLAASYLELDIMQTLVAGGATVTPALPDGTTPLLVAAGITIERRLNRPLDHVDTSTDIGDDCCDRPEDGVVEAVGILLDSGADLNEANLAGDTALHAAASNGYTTLIQLLADRGAKLDVKNQNGQTPLALTSGEEGRGRGRGVSPELEKAGELLRKLGATN